MGISELRQLRPSLDERAPEPGALDAELVRSGQLGVKDAALARHVWRHCDTSIERILLTENLVEEEVLLDAQARLLRTRQLSREELAETPLLDTNIAPQTLLKYAILPVQDRDGEPAIVCGETRHLSAAMMHLPVELRWARVLIAPRGDVLLRLAALYRGALTDAAQSRVPLIESCRSWARDKGRRLAILSAGICGLVGLTLAFPTLVLAVLMGWAALTLIVSAGFRFSAFMSQQLAPETARQPQTAGADTKEHPLPKVSILVPLFRETEIAHALIARLTQLTYPKCLLDVLLVLEEEDELTRQTLAQIDLPSWIRPVLVPDGAPRTKPRAMNYALDFCEGDIVGIFDAEDAPEPDQITKIARRFQQAPADVVCLQGILDYYNSRQNWIARCFTIEYATWFRTLMPGMARLGFAIPLGGTTLYFRRDALEALGGWDAHNVTEDADLGFRLARHGFATEMIDTVTQEEANCRPWAWIKQRSRWQKGYMSTYLVHMRQPKRLYQQLGALKFWGFQAHFVSAVSQVLLAPFLWSFWLVFFGLPHPLDAVVPRSAMVGLGVLFLLVEVMNMTLYAVSVRGAKHRHLLAWVPSMHFYWPLGAIAAYKALYELVFKPFFWDKTTHGLSLRHAPPPPRRVQTDNSFI